MVEALESSCRLNDSFFLIYLKIRKWSCITKSHFAQKNINNSSILSPNFQSTLTFPSCPQNVFYNFPPTKSQSRFIYCIWILYLFYLFNLKHLSHTAFIEVRGICLVERFTFWSFLIAFFWWTLTFPSIPHAFHL